jgi:hypothetical protein
MSGYFSRRVKVGRFHQPALYVEVVGRLVPHLFHIAQVTLKKISSFTLVSFLKAGRRNIEADHISRVFMVGESPTAIPALLISVTESMWLPVVTCLAVPPYRAQNAGCWCRGPVR